MKRFTVMCAALVLFATMAFGAGKVKSKWTVLFDGKNVENLRGYNMDSFPSDLWKIEEGSLKTVPGGKRVDLISREKYRDFELELEWRVPPGGNSGVFYGVQEGDPVVWRTGPEMQILDDSKHKDGGNALSSAGALYALLAPNSAKKLKSLGEFNKAKVIVRGDQVEHWLNGKKILEYTWGSPELTTLIGKSKFKDMPQFMKERNGHIALQHHGEEAWFRNIRIRRL